MSLKSPVCVLEAAAVVQHGLWGEVKAMGDMLVTTSVPGVDLAFPLDCLLFARRTAVRVEDEIPLEFPLRENY